MEKLPEQHKPADHLVAVASYEAVSGIINSTQNCWWGRRLADDWYGSPRWFDCSWIVDNLLKCAHIVTSTTHKTLRGPRGIILMGKDFDNPWGLTTKKGEVKKMSMLLNSAVFPGQQGGPLSMFVVAKAVAFNRICNHLGKIMHFRLLRYKVLILMLIKFIKNSINGNGHGSRTDAGWKWSFECTSWQFCSPSCNESLDPFQIIRKKMQVSQSTGYRSSSNPSAKKDNLSGTG